MNGQAERPSFAGTVTLVTEDTASDLKDRQRLSPDRDFGWMPFDTPYGPQGPPPQFRAIMHKGVVAIPAADGDRLFR